MIEIAKKCCYVNFFWGGPESPAAPISTPLERGIESKHAYNKSLWFDEIDIKSTDREHNESNTYVLTLSL